MFKVKNIWSKRHTWTFWSVVFVFFVILLIYGIFYWSLNISKQHTEIVRNIALSLVPLIGFPFLVWSYENAYDAKETAKKNLMETIFNNKRTQENKLYVDCVTQLSNATETIRNASMHGFDELLSMSQREIDTAQEEDEKNARIKFQDKILNILWSFMIEHSRKMENTSLLKVENNSNIELAQNEIYSQFRLILEILAKFRPYNYTSRFWVNKYWVDINLKKTSFLSSANLANSYLEGVCLNGADLRGTNLNNANLTFANLNGAYLGDADLIGADLSNADLRSTNLIGANLNNADLSNADLSNTDLNYTKLHLTRYTNHTKFPDNFDPKEHNMEKVPSE